MPTPREAGAAGIIALLATLGTGYAISQFQGGGVRICDTKGYCEELTAEEYKEMRTYLSTKLESNAQFTWDEVNVLRQVLDREFQENGDFTNVQNIEELKTEIVTRLKEE